jgi:hypothetical protein
MTPTSTIEIVSSASQGISDIYPSIDGSNVWVSSYSNNKGYYLVNTARPNNLLTSFCPPGLPCVPNINFTIAAGSLHGITGLDGSFWWNIDDGFYSADIYDPIAQTFVETNIPVVVGVNTDGVIIGFSKGKPGCWTVGSSYTSYVYRGPLLNYVEPEAGTNVKSDGLYNYMEMPVPEIIRDVNATAYYKVHTENGLCQINPDDYTYWVSQTNKYSLGISSIDKPYKVTSISNIYMGL